MNFPFHNVDFKIGMQKGLEKAETFFYQFDGNSMVYNFTVLVFTTIYGASTTQCINSIKLYK